MADVQHVSLTGSDLHEPKGVASAATGKVYVANGSGSGAWTLPGGFHYGEMKIETNSTAISLSAASDSTLNTDSDYVKVGSIWQTALVNGITYSNSYLLIAQAGLYHAQFWTSFHCSVLNTLVGFKYSSDDTNLTLDPRKLTRKSGAAGDVGSVAANSIASLAAGAKISIWAAADKACNITLVDGGLVLQLLKAS
jgi:hypothetical protein